MMTDSLKIDKKTGLLAGVSYLPSSHCDERPSETIIDMIVIHNISLPPGEFDTTHVEAFFCGVLDPSAHDYFNSIQHLKVSSHLFIKRNGEIIQFVPFTKRAWHAGHSSFNGRKACNDFSIGIELEGTDAIPYDKRQYAQLIRIIRLLMQAYPAINEKRIVGHADIAPGRKTDPGPAFDWEYLKGKLL